MNLLTTLLWLEWRRTAWVFYAAAVALALYTLTLLALPGVVTGPDLLGIPQAGQPADPDTQTTFEMRQEADADGEQRNLRFSRHWAFGSASQATPTQGADTRVDFELPDELQLAFRPRQATTLIGALFLSAAMLLGFLIAYMREADRREMVILYQSPVSPETLLAARFVFMSLASCLVFLAALAIYAAVQRSQSLAPGAPILEGFGTNVTLHWGRLWLASATTQVLPTAAFILLFVQMHNAYDLLGGQRLAGTILVLAGLVASVFSYDRLVTTAAAQTPSLTIVAVEGQPALDELGRIFDPTRYHYDLPLAFIATALALTLLMWGLATRVFREVEWS